MTTKTASRMSTLNPNAPLFIPASYLATEDFSPQWWHLVQTCPAFRDFWLRERFDSMEDEAATPPVLDTTDDFDLEDLLDMEMQNEELVKAVDMAPWKEANDVVSESEKDVIAALAGVSVNELRSQQRTWREPLKYHDKISNKGPRSPRKGGNNQFRIQQPRP